MFTLPLVTASAAADYSMFDIGVPYKSGGNVGVDLIQMSAPVVAYQYQCQAKMSRVSYNMNGANPGAWAQTAATADMQAVMAIMTGYVSPSMAAGKYKTAAEYLDEALKIMGMFPFTLQDYYDYGMAGYELQHTLGTQQAIERGVQGIEEYVGWCAVEKEEGIWDFDLYIRDAAYFKANGIDYIPKLLLQTMPQWFIDSGNLVKSINIVTGQEINVMSIFAQSTMDAYDRYYAAALEYLGEYIDAVRIASPYDFGELAYVAGLGDAQLYAVDSEAGYWIGDEAARANFKTTMENKYGTIDILNAAWGTGFAGFGDVAYPDMTIVGNTLTTSVNDRHFLDFMHWYYDGLTEGMRDIVHIAQKYFPDKPLNFNLAMPYEKTCFGFDISGLTKMAAEEGVITRLPTGTQVPWLIYKRFATAARLYSPPLVAVEPTGDNYPIDRVAQTFFMDLTSGVTWHKDYFGNHRTALPLNDAYNEAWHGGEYPIVDVALFWSNTSHFLDNGLGWYSPDPADPSHQLPIGGNINGGFPTPGLYLYCNSLRNVMDFDVIDELIVSDGFLDEYKYLIWPVGKVAEAETLEKVAAWVAAGGTLLITDVEAVRTVEGGSGAFGVISDIVPIDGTRSFGDGQVIDIIYSDGNLAGSLNDLIGKYSGYLNSADINDPVLVSEFKDGFIVYNRTNAVVDREIVSRYGVVADVTLNAYEFRFIEVLPPFVGATASAFVTKQNGNKNDLTITVTELYADGSENLITETFSIDNNEAGTYEVGGYKVYVDTKGNDQIRACYIVE